MARPNPNKQSVELNRTSLYFELLFICCFSFLDPRIVSLLIEKLLVAVATYKDQAETGEVKGHYLNCPAGTSKEMIKCATCAKDFGVPIKANFSLLYVFSLPHEAIEELINNKTFQIGVLQLCNKEVNPKINFLGNFTIEKRFIPKLIHIGIYIGLFRVSQLVLNGVLADTGLAVDVPADVPIPDAAEAVAEAAAPAAAPEAAPAAAPAKVGGGVNNLEPRGNPSINLTRISTGDGPRLRPEPPGVPQAPRAGINNSFASGDAGLNNPFSYDDADLISSPSEPNYYLDSEEEGESVSSCTEN